jgi:hypothetical protein
VRNEWVRPWLLAIESVMDEMRSKPYMVACEEYSFYGDWWDALYWEIHRS